MVNDDFDVADLGDVLIVVFVCPEQARSGTLASGPDELEQFFGKLRRVTEPIRMHRSRRKRDALSSELRNQGLDGRD